MTPNEYLDAAKEKLGITSDYELAKRLDVTRQRISAYRAGKEWPDVSACVRLAVILEKDPAAVITDLEAQHTKDAKKAAFLRDFALRASGTKTAAARTLASLFIGALLAVLAATGLNGPNGGSRFDRFRKLA